MFILLITDPISHLSPAGFLFPPLKLTFGGPKPMLILFETLFKKKILGTF